jgi:hypothetical protein
VAVPRVGEDDVEMTLQGGASGEASHVDEDPFEKQMRLSYETQADHLNITNMWQTTGFRSTGGMDQRNTNSFSHDNFSQEGIFLYWSGRLPGHAHVNQTYPDVVKMWRQFHVCPASGGGIERVFFSAGKQHDVLKKNTIDKTLESTWKASINTMLPTCDDKGVFTDDDDTYRKRKSR